MSDPTLFDGDTFDPEHDGERLLTQLQRVDRLMADMEWRTLRMIADAVGGSEAGVSARLRDLRKDKYGSKEITRQRVRDGSGLWQYRMEPF